jgi:hypothetical protein
VGNGARDFAHAPGPWIAPLPTLLTTPHQNFTRSAPFRPRIARASFGVAIW